MEGGAIAAEHGGQDLREQTSLAERVLDAHVEAIREGRPLPNSALPLSPSPATDAKCMGLWLLGRLAVVVGALTLPALLNK